MKKRDEEALFLYYFIPLTLRKKERKKERIEKNFLCFAFSFSFFFPAPCVFSRIAKKISPLFHTQHTEAQKKHKDDTEQQQQKERTLNNNF